MTDATRAARPRTVHRTGAAALAIAASSTLLLGGCAGENPSAVCAAPDTQQMVRKIILDEAKKASGEAAPMLEAPELGPLVKLELAVLKTYDKQTRLITCTANAHFSIPDALKPAFKEGRYKAAFFLRAGLPAADVPPALESGDGVVEITYTRQPAAGGDQFVYSVDDVAPLVRAWIVAAAAAVAAKAPAAASGAPAAASAPSAGPDDVAADNTTNETAAAVDPPAAPSPQQ